MPAKIYTDKDANLAVGAFTIDDKGHGRPEEKRN